MIENLSDEAICMICMLPVMFGMFAFWYIQYRALNEAWKEEMNRRDEEWEKVYKESNENWRRLHEESEKKWIQTCNQINESWKNTCEEIITAEVREMSKRYIIPKRKHTKSRKYNGKCEGCGAPKPLSEVYCYVDDVNPAINYNAPYLCRECYEKRYDKNG